jgi:phosphomannomutase
LLPKLPHDERLTQLSLLPTCGTKFYQYSGDWKKLYEEDFTNNERDKILSSLAEGANRSRLQSRQGVGRSDRRPGQPDNIFRTRSEGAAGRKKQMGSRLCQAEEDQGDSRRSFIPQFSVRIGGSTSIDITKPGIDKAYGIGKLRDLLHISLKEMIYIGDALFPGGNDYPAEKAGVDCIPVKGPEQTKQVIKTIIACLSDREQAA